jgi:transposase InsO family protein
MSNREGSAANIIEQAEEIHKRTRQLPSKGRRYSTREIEILLKASDGMSAKDASDRFGISISALLKWRKRADRNSDHRPNPDDHSYSGHHRNWARVIELWKTRPGLGPAQIRNQLRREGIYISVATVRSVLEENGYTPPKPSIKQKEVTRYEAVRPGELVHLDFKHFFINKHKAYLLLFQDDYSRFICSHRLSDSENVDAVIEAFEECVGRYGKMQSIMTDAGSAFYSWNGINRFQRLISEEYGVDQIKATSPRSNGKIESVNKQIEKELLRAEYFESITEASHAISDWVRFYNFGRVHMGLPDGNVPADRYLYGWNCHLGEEKKSPVPVIKLAPTKPVTPISLTTRNEQQSVWEDLIRVAIKKIS